MSTDLNGTFPTSTSVHSSISGENLTESIVTYLNSGGKIGDTLRAVSSLLHFVLGLRKGLEEWLMSKGGGRKLRVINVRNPLGHTALFRKG